MGGSVQSQAKVARPGLLASVLVLLHVPYPSRREEWKAVVVVHTLPACVTQLCRRREGCELVPCLPVTHGCLSEQVRFWHS